MALVIELGCNEGSGDALDTSGNGNHANNSQGGTWGGVGTGYYAGGNSLQTTGTGTNRWIVPFNASWAGMRTSYSFTCWYNRTAAASVWWQTLLSHPNSGVSDNSFSLYGYQETAIYHGPSPLLVDDAGTGWHHMACTFGGGVAVIYRDGVQIGDSSSFPSPADPSSTQALNFGGNPIWVDETLAGGYLDQIRCYDHAITLQDVIDDMNTEIGSGAPVLVVPDSLVSLSAVESVAVTSVTLDTGNVLPAITGATATVNSYSDEGLIYCAVRPVAFGPYGAGDEEAIKNGTDATWYENGGKTPVIGINTFLPTGLSEATDYHCGFVQETGGLTFPGYEVIFNADLGGLTFARTGPQMCFDNNGDLVLESTTDEPCYVGAEHNGSAWLPHDDCLGVFLTPAETGVLLPTDGNIFVNYWSYFEIDVGSTVQHGAMEFSEIRHTTATPTEEFISRIVHTAQDTPWSWLCFVMEGVSPNFSIEMDPGGAAHFAWVGGELTTDGVEGTDTEQYCYKVAGGVWAAGIKLTDPHGANKSARFHPQKKGITPIVNHSTWLHPGTWQDSLTLPGNLWASTDALSTYTVAECGLEQTLANLGVNDLTTEVTVHMQFYVLSNDITNNTAHYFFELRTAGTDHLRFGSYSDGIRVRVNVDGSGTARQLYPVQKFTPGKLCDLRCTVRGGTGVDSLRFWFTSDGSGTAGERLTIDNIDPWTTALKEVRLAGAYIFSHGLILQKLRIHDVALSDAQVEALT
jgi:hypothetical protein